MDEDKKIVEVTFLDDGDDREMKAVLAALARVDAKKKTVSRSTRRIIKRGGEGSGHHGHEGRPGEVGGSAPSDGGGTKTRPQPRFTDEDLKPYLESANFRTLQSYTGSEEYVNRLRGASRKSEVATEPEWVYETRQLRAALTQMGVLKKQAVNLIEEWADRDYADPEKLWQDAIKQALRNKGTLPANLDELMASYAEKHFVGRGGVGSGHYDHAGRPGKRGGSAPSGDSKPSEAKEPRKYVGITSNREGTEEKQVRADMKAFERELKAIRTIKNPSVSFGTGGWDGGAEPTWVVSYEGNGEATKLLARTGKQHSQNAVLLYEDCQGKNCSPAVDWVFKETITPEYRKEIERALVDAGIGGWTWFEKDGQPALRAVAVPQWGGDRDKHLTAAKTIDRFFNGAGLSATRTDFDVTTTIMEKEGDFSYDSYLDK